MGALGAMLAVSGVADLRAGAWVDGMLQISLAVYLVMESFPRVKESGAQGSWITPALIAAGIVFLLMRTVLRGGF
jgi:hypothetical protein